jgi:hypothetical protein
MTLTFESPVPPADRTTPSTFRTTSRMEPRDCRYGTTTVNGDPYIQMSSEHVTTGSLVAGTISGSTSTMRTTGGLRFETNGVQGRAKYDCTDVLTITYPTTPGGSLQISRQSSGTVTWEQPLGSPVVRPCGPV